MTKTESVKVVFDKLLTERDVAYAIYINNESCGCESEAELSKSFDEYRKAENAFQRFQSSLRY